MIQKSDLRFQEKCGKTTAPCWCLLTIGIIDLLIIVFGPYVNFYLEEFFLIPSAVYLFHILRQEKTRTAKLVFLLGAVMCTWFVIAQFIHHCMGLQTRPLGSFLSVYLIALTFAVITRDERKGLLIYRNIFLVGMLIVLMYIGLLMMGRVPLFFRTNIHFWKHGLVVMIHPSQLAGFLLIGIGFILVTMFMTKRMCIKAIALMLLVLLSLVLAMTKCHSAKWLMCLLYGVVCFLAINKGGFLRFVAGIAAAVVIFSVTFFVSQNVIEWYDYKSGWKTRGMQSQGDNAICISKCNQLGYSADVWNNEDTYDEHMPMNSRWNILMRSAEAESIADESVSERFSFREVLDKLLPNLNGRKRVWLSVYDMLKKDILTMIVGTDYTSEYTSGTLNHNHMHNSWFEVIVALGLPGFLLALVFSAIALWHILIIVFSKQYQLWQKCIALMTVCLMAVGALEPHLFLGGLYQVGRSSLHPSDFTFFLCLGYMIQWRATDKASRKKLLEEATQEIVPVKE